MKKYVLLIDDDKDLLKILELKLLRDGYEVKTLLSGADFLDTIWEKIPDLILIDVNMPYIAGNALCKILKKNKSTEAVPVVIFSGNENIDKISLACGADGFITKPCEPNVFSKEINKYLA